jgi:ribonuclease HII
MATRAIRIGPDFEVESQALSVGRGPVVGVDEAGRGPWAGPVVAAAVVLEASRIPPGIDDSKLLEPTKREELFEALIASGAVIGIGIAEVDRIARMNILAASLWAMRRAVTALKVRPALALVDGNCPPRLTCKARTVVGGDAKCLSIAAASIVAKVTRDRIMVELGARLPQYGFERHKGYGTPEHRDAIARHGVCKHHRRSFEPIRLALGLTEADDVGSDAAVP